MTKFERKLLAGAIKHLMADDGIRMVGIGMMGWISFVRLEVNLVAIGHEG
jgi:hypothetical protein